jgi:hypothetical protein
MPIAFSASIPTLYVFLGSEELLSMPGFQPPPTLFFVHHALEAVSQAS